MSTPESASTRRRFLKSFGGMTALAAAPQAAAQTPAAAPDRALSITWYDLPEEGRGEYLQWLHEIYMPRFVQRPGYLWAAHYASQDRSAQRDMGRGSVLRDTEDHSVPRGHRFILIFGAESAKAFGERPASAMNVTFGDTGRKMLALRSGERSNLMMEALRVDGLGLAEHKSGSAPPPCIQLGSFNCAVQDEEEMLAWYTLSRMPAMGAQAGVVRTRKLCSVAGWAKHAILYEFLSLELRNRDYVALEAGRPDLKAWSERMVPKLTHAPYSPNLATRLALVMKG
jgi:hypothetical protein